MLLGILFHSSGIMSTLLQRLLYGRDIMLVHGYIATDFIAWYYFTRIQSKYQENTTIGTGG